MRTSSLQSGFALVFLALALVIAVVSSAWAQAPPTPITPRIPAPSPSVTPTDAPAGGNAGAGTVIGLALALLVIVGVGVKLYDLKRTRESEAVHLQAQLSDALLREPGLSGLPLTPTARVSTFKGSPAMVEISGQVPTAEAREHALRVVRAEAARIRPDVEIEDRIAIVPSMGARVA